MIINGREIAQTLKQELREGIARLSRTPVLSVLICASDSVTTQFTRVKKRIGEAIGVEVDLVHLDEVIQTDLLIEKVQEYAEKSEGVIVQLPLPKHIDTEAVLEALPANVDVDVLGSEAQEHFKAGKTDALPPVVAAIREILERNNVAVSEKHVVIVGEGRLVGAPAQVWFEHQGAKVDVTTLETNNLKDLLPLADIVVSGAGSPGLITPELIKRGVIILDASTSESNGVVVGDADPRCAEKASFFTPVPGGIGPIAVAVIFKNLLSLVDRG